MAVCLASGLFMVYGLLVMLDRWGVWILLALLFVSSTVFSALPAVLSWRQ